MWINEIEIIDVEGILSREVGAEIGDSGEDIRVEKKHLLIIRFRSL